MRIGASVSFLVAAILVLAGCEAGDTNQNGAGPVSGVAASCQHACNTAYDSCMGRFAGIPGAQNFSPRQDDPSTMVGPNAICPDQFKDCIARCSI